MSHTTDAEGQGEQEAQAPAVTITMQQAKFGNAECLQQAETLVRMVKEGRIFGMLILATGMLPPEEQGNGVDVKAMYSGVMVPGLFDKAYVMARQSMEQGSLEALNAANMAGGALN